uniref:EGF domain-specific O-linked N-acetylglucosamine transferase n=1 Tax=Ascaris suum TaxID=6253 RepID=F1L2A5_ASCSU
MSLYAYMLLLISLESVISSFMVDLNVPEMHLPYIAGSSVYLRAKCSKDVECKAKFLRVNEVCWGYEHNCSFSQSYSSNKIRCSKESLRGSMDIESRRQTFWRQADFGKVLDTINSITSICTSSTKDGSFLECSDHLRFCRASNIFFDFKNLNAPTSKRYRDDVIQEGDVGGRCEFFDRKLLTNRADEKSYLQSWANELENFKSYEDFRVDETHCDVIFERPTVVMKLDASINMYHHFCDFINLYLSQHLNGSFDSDIDILWWDTFPGGFIDASFGATWRAFSLRQPYELISLDQKRVCFRQVMLPLLARQRLGLYYNMPVIDGCEGSGLFHAFSKHILHRLRVNQTGPLLNSVRVTLLSRSTNFRRIVNENELLDVLNGISGVVAQKVDYNSNVAFFDQLSITHNTDIFIGMHGSGLTHLLFLPDWAVIFEIYNCEDVSCYYDLARLRGVKYFTWKKVNKMEQIGEGKHPQIGTPHKKFANYRFDKDEFRRLVLQQVEYVRRHPAFVKEQMRLRRSRLEDEL